MDIGEIDYICANINRDRLGGFCNALVEAWLQADLENKVILQWAMTRIIAKYLDDFKVPTEGEKAAS